MSRLYCPICTEYLGSLGEHACSCGWKYCNSREGEGALRDINPKTSDTALQRENADLKRQIESMHYDLDAMSEIKEERDALMVLCRQALEALEQARSFSEGGARKAQIAITALRERLK
jgi:hypothetical protein